MKQIVFLLKMEVIDLILKTKKTYYIILTNIILSPLAPNVPLCDHIHTVCIAGIRYLFGNV
jgi:hypothetical protein